jgi:hypothetical protein
MGWNSLIATVWCTSSVFDMFSPVINNVEPISITSLKFSGTTIEIYYNTLKILNVQGIEPTQ